LQDVQPDQEAPTSPLTSGKKRPRLDLTGDTRERKRGKSIFGIVLGTLNKAKIEDRERNASEAVRPICKVAIFATTNEGSRRKKGS
jgi:hypothetical protein